MATLSPTNLMTVELGTLNWHTIYNADIEKINEFFKKYHMSLVDKGSVSGSITIDWNDGNAQKLILAGDTTISFSGGNTGDRFYLVVIQDATGNHNVSWDSNIVFTGISNDVLKDANAITIFEFLLTDKYYCILNSSGLVASFLDLGDTPSSYSGYADKVVKVKSDETGLEFGDVMSGSIYVFDNTEVSTTSTSYETKKAFDLAKLSDINHDWNNLVFVITGKVTSGNTLTVGFFIDGVEKSTLTFTETVYTLKHTTIDISDYTNGLYSVEMKMKVDGGTGYSKFFEAWVE